ncbi:MAG: hypothetical protein M1826_000265 [Phylliscum demangeonii]|nr:MAG: hypothetical protein M1826_000265 [Phylliscum demangeonii]
MPPEDQVLVDLELAQLNRFQHNAPLVETDDAQGRKFLGNAMPSSMSANGTGDEPVFRGPPMKEPNLAAMESAHAQPPSLQSVARPLPSANPAESEIKSTSAPSFANDEDRVPSASELPPLVRDGAAASSEAADGDLPKQELPRADHHHSSPEDPRSEPERAEEDRFPPSVETKRDAPAAVVAVDDDDDDDEESGTKLEDRVKKAPKRLEQYSKYVQLMEDRMTFLEEKFRKLENRGELVPPPEVSRQTEGKAAIPELRYVRWEDFKTKYVDEQTYAIEVLVGGARYWYQRQNDEWMRRWRAGNEDPAAAYEGPDGQDPESNDELPERIRINSRPLLAILCNVCLQDAGEWAEPRVMLRPFKLLVRYDAQIREVYDKLAAQWAEKGLEQADAPAPADAAAAAHAEGAEVAPDAAPVDAAEKADHDAERTKLARSTVAAAKNKTSKDASDDLVGSLEALKDLQCLIDFMDQRIAPVVERFRNRSRRSVQFHELWLLFKAGDLIYCPRRADLAQKEDDAAPSDAVNQGRYQIAFKIFHVDGGRAKLSRKDNVGDQPSLKDRLNPFQIWSYYVDYDGENYGAVGNYTTIQPFEGERQICSLEAFPLDYADNYPALYEELKARGLKFQSVLHQKHLFYEGTTYTSNPNGSIPGILSKHSEHVNSEVIVDFTEGFKLGPAKALYNADLEWLEEHITTTKYADEFDEDYPTTIWRERNQKEVHSHRSDNIFNDDTMDLRYSKMHLTTDPFLKSVTEIDTEVGLNNQDAVRQDDILLLPSRVIGYVLRGRKWALLNVQFLRSIVPKSDGFKDLKLPSGHKEMVQALVRSHSMRRDIDAAAKDSTDFDVVRGKGRGLIILLHGVPGVGKTSTAECVAESTGKPLFPITCGDLGLLPQEVEESLQSIFHLAQTWDCVLLLDEADIFLAQRTRTDLKRNALVSVFLRVLEYYMGILFLTTNRVGAFDEAFKSRIHISLYYPELAKPQAMKIWEMNLERTKKIDRERTKTATIPGLVIDEDEIRIFAEDHWIEHHNAIGKWNGRQIRNAFQTASALALYEAHMQNVERLTKAERVAGAEDVNGNGNVVPIAPQLGRRHFEKVAKSTLQFDQYMEETLGKSDADAAHFRGDRTDRFRPSPRPDRQPPPQQQQQQPYGGGRMYAGPPAPPDPGPYHDYHDYHDYEYVDPSNAPLPPLTSTRPSAIRSSRGTPRRSLRPESSAPPGLGRGGLGGHAHAHGQTDFVEYHAQTAWTGGPEVAKALGAPAPYDGGYEDEDDFD